MNECSRAQQRLVVWRREARAPLADRATQSLTTRSLLAPTVTKCSQSMVQTSEKRHLQTARTTQSLAMQTQLDTHRRHTPRGSPYCVRKAASTLKAPHSRAHGTKMRPAASASDQANAQRPKRAVALATVGGDSQTCPESCCVYPNELTPPTASPPSPHASAGTDAQLNTPTNADDTCDG